MHLIDHMDETLRRWPGPLPVPASTWWPDWARRSCDALHALVASAAAAHRARASRQQLLRELEHLDDRMLLDIGVRPSALRHAQRIELGCDCPFRGDREDHMHPHVLHRQPAPISTRVARAAAFSLCRAAACLYRAAQAMERREPPEEERQYVRSLLASHGKLD